MNLIIEGVSKDYGSGKWGLKNISLNMKPGIIGLLGPNGAGKSTLMRILSTITKPTTGIVKWNGEDIIKNPNSLRKLLGYLPQDFGVYPNLNAIEFLNYIASIKGLSRPESKRRIDELVEVVNLANVCKRPMKSYSGGMRQRVGIAQALINDPQLLIIDEPTVGLDPEERLGFRNLLSDLSGERIILFSTHIVSDIEATAAEIVIMNQGKLLAHLSPEDLLKKAYGNVWELTVSSSELNEARKKWSISSSIRKKDGVLLRIVSNSLPDENAKSAIPSLEDAYLYFTTSGQGKEV